MLTFDIFSSLAVTCCLQLYHRALTLSQDEVSAALSHTSLDQMWQRDLRPLLVTRYPGSLGGQEVQEVSHLPLLNMFKNKKKTVIHLIIVGEAHTLC